MRVTQIIIFFISVLLFLGAVFFIGQGTGDTLWRAGTALILIDLAFIKIWPSPKSK